MRCILQLDFGVLRSLAGVYYMLHGLDYSYLRPRPRHRQANPEAVATYEALELAVIDSWNHAVMQSNLMKSIYGFGRSPGPQLAHDTWPANDSRSAAACCRIDANSDVDFRARFLTCSDMRWLEPSSFSCLARKSQ